MAQRRGCGQCALGSMARAGITLDSFSVRRVLSNAVVGELWVHLGLGRRSPGPPSRPAGLPLEPHCSLSEKMHAADCARLNRSPSSSWAWQNLAQGLLISPPFLASFPETLPIPFIREMSFIQRSTHSLLLRCLNTFWSHSGAEGGRGRTLALSLVMT